jgi:hypothetical protein
MAAPIVTNCDIGHIAIRAEICRDEILNASGAKTYLAGTILAKPVVTATPTAAAGTNTGNGTCTVLSVIAGPTIPQVGGYVLKCVTAVTNGGVFQLSNPAGQILHTGLTMTVGAGAATVFSVSGLRFTLTDGSTDFAVGDLFTITTVANTKLIPYAPVTGVGGEQTPYAVLQYPVVAAGAGSIPVRPIIFGEVNRTRLILDADGTGVNVTDGVVAALRAVDIIATDVQQLALLDD